MKQLLMILLLLFATELSAQTFIPDDSSSVGKRGKYTNTTTVDGHDPYKLNITPVIDVTKSSFTLPTGFTGDYNYFSVKDTLSGPDTSTVIPNHMADGFYLEITDTGATYTDSLIVEVQSESGGSWYQKSVGLYRLYDGLFVGGDIVIPGANITKKYYFVDEKIYSARARWYYGADKTGRKVPLKWIGVN